MVIASSVYEDAGNAHSELMSTSTNAVGDVPIDIAAGPDRTPVQLKIKFPATLKGIKAVAFALTGTTSCWLEHSRERDEAYVIHIVFSPQNIGSTGKPSKN